MNLPSWTFWIALIAMTIGLLGVLVPVLPDVIFIWFVILVYTVADGFAAIDLATFAGLTLLAGLGFSAEFWMSQAGAKASGASNWSILAGAALGLVGGTVGFIFFGVGAVPGAIVGALAGLTLAEWYQRRDWGKTVKVVAGWLVGYFLSIGVQLSIGLLMILVFVWRVLRG